MTSAERKALAAFAKNRSRAELEALFALIRREKDAALFAALAPAKKTVARAGDPLVAEITKLFAPILASAAEKGDLLAAHMAEIHRNTPVFEAKGLSDAIKRLRARFSDAQIRTAAKGLLAKLDREFGRDSVS